MKTISKKMLIGDVIEKYPDLAEVLVMKYGLHCAGCMGAAMETLEDGAMAHGMTGKDVDKMVVALNKRIA
jgi:hybrid cluster-associated redox disulfide protein